MVKFVGWVLAYFWFYIGMEAHERGLMRLYQLAMCLSCDVQIWAEVNGPWSAPV